MWLRTGGLGWTLALAILPSKLVCPNVSFLVVTESILFRLVNLCSSYGATVASCSRFLLMGRLDEENKQADAGRFVHIVETGDSFSMRESWVCFDMNVFKFIHQ